MNNDATPIMARVILPPVIGNVSIAAVRYFVPLKTEKTPGRNFLYTPVEGRALVVDGEIQIRYFASMPPCFKQPLDWPIDVYESVKRLIPEGES